MGHGNEDGHDGLASGREIPILSLAMFRTVTLDTVATRSRGGAVFDSSSKRDDPEV